MSSVTRFVGMAFTAAALIVQPFFVANFTTAFASGSTAIVDQNFDSFTGSNAPTNWTVSGTGAYTGVGYCGAAVNCVKFNHTTTATATLTLPLSSGQAASTLSFYLGQKSAGDDSDKLLTVEQFNGPVSLGSTVYTTSQSNLSLNANTTKIIFSSLASTGNNLSFDDVVVTASEVTPADYNGMVTVAPSSGGAIMTTLSSTNTALNGTFTISSTSTSGEVQTVGGLVNFVNPANSCSFNGQINTNGYDTYFIELTGCSTPVSGHLYLYGDTSSTTSSFVGTFVNQAGAMTAANSLSISGPTSVEVGATGSYSASLIPAGASGSVRWSVYDGTGSATINETTGELTGVSAGTVQVIASVANGPVLTKNYPITIETPTVSPTAPPTVPSTSGNVIFDSLPTPFPSNSSSLGFAATKTAALGDKISFAGSDRTLKDVQVNLSSWACESGAWNLGTCLTTPGATYTHPITLNIYNVAGDGSVGGLIATRTQTFTIPYRPTANPACSNTQQWMDTNDDCSNGINNVITFDMSGVVVPDTVIYSVAYNTQNYGTSPIGVSGPYDSLNVGFNTVSTSPSVGADVNSDELYWDTTYPGYTAGLKVDSGWGGYMVAAKFTAITPDTTKPTVTLKSSSIGSATYNVFTSADFKLYDNNKVVSYSVNGHSYNVSPSAWSDANGVKVGVRSGVYGENTITVTDASGNVSDSLVFYLDNVGPTVTVKSDSTGYQDVYSKINFKLYDEHKVARYQVNGGPWHNLTPNNWSDANNIAVGVNGGVQGDNAITVEDVAGNKTTQHFTLDAVAPEITVKTDLPFTIGSETESIYSEVSFKLHDNDMVRRYFVNGHEYDVTPNAWSDANYISVGVHSGVYGQNKIVLEDRAGNTTEYDFVLDNVAPTITAKDGYIGDLSTATFSDVSFKLFDEYKADKYLLNGWTSDFTNNKWSDANYQNIKSHLVQGENTIVLYDVAGNSSSYTFYYDTTPPLVTITTPTTTLQSPNVTIQGTVDSSVSGQVHVTIDGFTVDVTPDSYGNWSAAFSGVATGNYNVTAVAYDAIGNEGLAIPISITVQSAPAVTDVVTPTLPTFAPANTVTVNNTVNNTQTQNTDNNGQEVLADETTNSDNSNSSEVKSDETTASTSADATKDDTCWKILGLCWYWWIVIIAGVIAVIYLIRRYISDDDKQ